MNNGWIKLHRKITDNELWFSEPFTKAQAWIDLVLGANHKDNIISIRGNIVNIKRGQIGWSELTMAKRWTWSKGKVRRFLKRLETIQQIEQQKYRYITTIITIINYKQYQSDTADSTADGQQTDSRQYINKNDKNVKNDKNKIASPKNDADKNSINKVFDVFYKINPTINFGNNTQRKAIKVLVDKFGLDETVAMAEYACRTQGQKYAPTITTPYQLKEKLAQLKVFKSKEDKNKPNII